MLYRLLATTIVLFWITMTALLVMYVRSATARWDLRLRQAGMSALRALMTGAFRCGGFPVQAVD